MGLEDEVVLIRDQLIQISTSNDVDGSRTEEALDLLEALQRLEIDLDLLVKTRIGRAVNDLRKSTQDDNVNQLCRILIKKWRRLLSSPAPAPASAPKRAPATAPIPSPAPANPDLGSARSSSFKSSESGNNSSTSSSSEDKGGMPKDMTNAVRFKCREMLTTSLKVGAVPDGCAGPEIMAAQLEEAIFAEFNNTDTRYKNRIRSRVSNLKDPKNPELRRNFLCGAISVEQLVKMTPEQMASNEMKKLREKFVLEAINAAQLAFVESTADVFDCSNVESPSKP